MTFTDRFENLLGIPSYHFSPVFAAEVGTAIQTFRPTAVALEAPPEAAPLLEWAVACWPTAVCAVVGSLVYPFVPGDSILEAFRLAKAAKLSVYLIDAFVRRRRERNGGVLPDPTLATRVGPVFREAVEALDATPPQPADLAREATMAAALGDLMCHHERVLWVGGMAHWRRVVQRLREADFAAPRVAPLRWREPIRLRLSPNAMLELTGCYPWIVERFATAPRRFDEVGAVRELALAALEETKELDDVVLIAPGEDAVSILSDEERGTTADVAKVLAYARNLAATARISDCPGLHELLIAAFGTVGRRYAGRLLTLALRHEPSSTVAQLGELDVVGEGGGLEFRVGRRRRRLVPAWGDGHRRGGWRLVLAKVISRSLRDNIFDGLPTAKTDETHAWCCYPPDEDAYEGFVRYVLRRASTVDPAEARTLPFMAGLRDGIDVRTTLRRWHEGKILVREKAGARLHVTNGIIDWEHANELDPDLQAPSWGGWIDPSLLHVGSASRDRPAVTIQQEPFVELVQRTFSLITLDCPTSLTQYGSKSFYARVIERLVNEAGDNLYEWLDVFFEFCAGKPVVYYSRYVPGPRVHEVAQRHRVRITHLPLARIPGPLLRRARSFRFAYLTRAQREALVERVAQRRARWMADIPRTPHADQPSADETTGSE